MILLQSKKSAPSLRGERSRRSRSCLRNTSYTLIQKNSMGARLRRHVEKRTILKSLMDSHPSSNCSWSVSRNVLSVGFCRCPFPALLPGQPDFHREQILKMTDFLKRAMVAAFFHRHHFHSCMSLCVHAQPLLTQLRAGCLVVRPPFSRPCSCVHGRFPVLAVCFGDRFFVGALACAFCVPRPLCSQSIPLQSKKVAPSSRGRSRRSRSFENATTQKILMGVRLRRHVGKREILKILMGSHMSSISPLVSFLATFVCRCLFSGNDEWVSGDRRGASPWTTRPAPRAKILKMADLFKRAMTDTLNFGFTFSLA